MHQYPPSDRRIASIVIPAHNEERGIVRLLRSLTDGDDPDLFRIVVVANGCVDSTAQQARSVSSMVDVIELGQASKSAALRRGDESAQIFPRVYIDADVVINADSVRRLVACLGGGIEASAPRRIVDRTGVHFSVCWFYDVWERLPQVQTGLFGRGVIAVSREGYERIAALPLLMADDLAASELFEVGETRIDSRAVVGIRPPKTLNDLIRRRIRVATGSFELDQVGIRRAQSQTTPRTLFEIVRKSPLLAPKLAVFVGVSIYTRYLARRRVRSGDFHTWLRDESSREDV